MSKILRAPPLWAIANGNKPYSVLTRGLSDFQRGSWQFTRFAAEINASISNDKGYQEVSTNNGSASAGNWSADIDDQPIAAARLQIPDDTAGAEEGAGLRQYQVWLKASSWDAVGVMGYATRVQVDNPPSATDEYQMSFGIADNSATQDEPDDGIYWYADETIGQQNWFLKHSTGGTKTTANTGIAVATDTWQELIWIFDYAAGTIKGYVDGVEAALLEPAALDPVAAASSIAFLHGDAAPTRANEINCYVESIGWGVDFER